MEVTDTRNNDYAIVLKVYSRQHVASVRAEDRGKDQDKSGVRKVRLL